MSCFINYLIESPLEQHDITIFKAIVCNYVYILPYSAQFSGGMFVVL